MAYYQVPGQSMLVDGFRQLIDEGRVPHAMLIHEQPGGTGLALALHLARTLLCERTQGGDPCDACPQCVKSAQHTHPDLHFVFPTNTNARFKKTEQRFSDNFYPEWREALSEHPYFTLSDWYKKIEIEKKQGLIGDEDIASLRRKLSLRAHGGKYRVFIIWHADKMNQSFANKILKNLEEPSDKTIFILVSGAPAQLLPTIISRVQIFREEPVSEVDLAAFLVQQFEVDDANANAIASQVEGDVSRAIKQALEQEEPWIGEFKAWMRMAYTRDLSGLLHWSDTMSKRTRDDQKHFCDEAATIIDRCYRMGWLNTSANTMGDEAKFYKDFSPFINTANAQEFLDLLEAAHRDIERNMNNKIIWFDSSIQATRLIHSGKKAAAETTNEA